MSDVKHSIRKLEFPFWAREALLRIEQFITNGNFPPSKNHEIINEIIKDFIFCECDRRGSRKTSGLDSLQELHLLDVLCEYFSEPLSDDIKNWIFLSLFTGPDANKRIKVLCKLTSMAISSSITPVLQVIGIWLQQSTCAPKLSIQLAENLIRDYFILHPKNDKSLNMLPKISPLFVSNLMTVIVEIYLTKGSNRTFSPPPLNLLEIITNWVISDVRLCLSAQLNSLGPPCYGVSMTSVSPLTGLIQWCVLAPLFISKQITSDFEQIIEPPSKKIKLEKTYEQPNVNIKCTSLSERDFYAKLHLGVLQCMYESKKTYGSTAIAAVNASSLTSTINHISQRVAHLQVVESNTSIDSKLQICLDRMVQAIQIAFATQCIFGNIQNLLIALNTLPDNRMLRIFLKNHQQPNL